MSATRELCEKVLANGIISRSGKANAENAHAAPRLAKMLLKAIGELEYVRLRHKLECPYFEKGGARETDCTCDARTGRVILAELDRIAAGEQV